MKRKVTKISDKHVFEPVKVVKKENVELPRCKEDYKIEVNKENLPSGIEIKEWQEDKIF